MIATVPKTPRMLRLSAADNVLVAIDTVDKGAEAPEGIVALDRIGKGHKMAATEIRSGEPVRKFGQIIGFAKQDIPKGAWVATTEFKLNLLRPVSSGVCVAVAEIISLTKRSGVARIDITNDGKGVCAAQGTVTIVLPKA